MARASLFFVSQELAYKPLELFQLPGEAGLLGERGSAGHVTLDGMAINSVLEYIHMYTYIYIYIWTYIYIYIYVVIHIF